jgi:hypothetical protein
VVCVGEERQLGAVELSEVTLDECRRDHLVSAAIPDNEVSTNVGNLEPPGLGNRLPVASRQNLREG